MRTPWWQVVRHHFPTNFAKWTDALANVTFHREKCNVLPQAFVVHPGEHVDKMMAVHEQLFDAKTRTHDLPLAQAKGSSRMENDDNFDILTSTGKNFETKGDKQSNQERLG